MFVVNRGHTRVIVVTLNKVNNFFIHQVGYHLSLVDQQWARKSEFNWDGDWLCCR